MKVVIIDDETVICQGLSRMIESHDWGWQVEKTFINPEDALENCNWEEVQCVLMDIDMPSIDGLSLAHILNEREYDVDIIFITAYSSFEFAQRAIDEHPVSYLLKPISKENLRQSLLKAEQSWLKKQESRSDPVFIKENLDALRKVFLENIVFNELDYTAEEIRTYMSKYDLNSKKFALYELLTPLAYHKLKEILRTLCKKNEWYIYGHAYFFVIIFLYKENNNEIEDILSRIEATCCFGEKGILIIEHLQNIYRENLPLIREQYGNYAEISDIGNQTLELPGDEEYSIPIKETISYIEQNLNKVLTLQKIASYVYLHPTYLSNMFKKQTGMNLMAYINSRRIEQAKELLHDPTVKVSWVVERVGFSNRKYFEKVFKDTVGMTPTQYKQDVYFLHDRKS